jgi:hypothetical protein
VELEIVFHESSTHAFFKTTYAEHAAFFHGTVFTDTELFPDLSLYGVRELINESCVDIAVGTVERPKIPPRQRGMPLISNSSPLLFFRETKTFKLFSLAGFEHDNQRAVAYAVSQLLDFTPRPTLDTSEG